MADCLFCKICCGEVPSIVLYEDADIMAFEDIDPKAPVHFLVVPKRHIDSADDLTAGDGPLLGKIFATIASLCKEKGIENGHRIVINIGPDGGQSVNHLHFHVLGGRALGWPPG